MEHKDIFISYRNDGCGNQFAHRLVADLEKAGYSVYFNPYEHRADDFSEKLRIAVENCRDFVLILSPGCLEQLKRNEAVDWVREEILMARESGKHFIPILIEGAELPKHADDMPENLRFLPRVDAITFPEDYVHSPFSKLVDTFFAKPSRDSAYRDTFNSNPNFDVNEDFKAVREAAEQGDLDAMYELGMMYYYGVTNEQGISERDPSGAYYWLQRLANRCSGFIDETKKQGADSLFYEQLRCHALSLISKLYYAGLVPGEAQSYEKAFRCLEEASQWDNFAALNKSFMLRTGLGCQFDYDKIIDYHVNSVQHKDDQFLLTLASFLTRHGRFQEAMKLYESLTNVSPEADYRIGVMYLNGLLSNPPMPDPINASYYLRNAADNNHATAAYELGRLCFRPTGKFRKNFVDAQKYLTFAADHGLADAQYILGYMYEKGHVEKSMQKAVHYYEIAKEQKHTHAALALAKCYQEPEFQNYQLAYECAELAASHGLAEAELLLGNFLFWGRGCKPDVYRAISLYERALEHGIHYASIMLEKARKSLR